MRNRKKTITTLLTAAILLIAAFAAGRYGWKLLGFRACEEAGTESVEVSETTVTGKGFCPGSFPEGFCGYYAEEQDGTVFVGFRFSAVFGFFKTGDFEVSIPTRGEIRKVVLKTGLAERTIWTARPQAASPLRRTRPPDPTVSACMSSWSVRTPVLSPCRLTASQRCVKMRMVRC